MEKEYLPHTKDKIAAAEVTSWAFRKYQRERKESLKKLVEGSRLVVGEDLTWRDADDVVMATEVRRDGGRGRGFRVFRVFRDSAFMRVGEARRGGRRGRGFP